jgi:hypothetical protein
MSDRRSKPTSLATIRTGLINSARVSELNLRPAVMVGMLIAVATVAAGLLTREFSDVAPMRLLETMMPTVRFFTSAVMTVAATTLALMLTLLSLSFNSGSRLRPIHYQRLRQVALVDCITFVAASLFMLVLLVSVPLEEAAALPPRWLGAFYLFVVGAMGVLGGLLAGIVLMLFGALRDMIDVLALGKQDGRLVVVERQE